MRRYFRNRNSAIDWLIDLLETQWKLLHQINQKQSNLISCWSAIVIFLNYCIEFDSDMNCDDDYDD